MSKIDLKLVEIPKYGLWSSSQNVRLFEDILEVFLSYRFLVKRTTDAGVPCLTAGKDPRACALTVKLDS